LITTHTLRVLSALIALAGLFVYLQGLSGPLLFDDVPNISDNALLAIDGNTFDEWRTAALSSPSGPLRRPIAMLSFAAQHVLAGEFSPFALKFVNIVIHFVIGWLVYLLCGAVFGSVNIDNPDALYRARYIALLAALLWLLHPLHVSTVLYTVQRMAQLSTGFIVLGLLVFVRYRHKWALVGASVGEVLAAALWLMLITVFAAYSKENGALLPWLLVATEVSMFAGRWGGQRIPLLAYLAWTALVLPLVLCLIAFLLVPEWFFGLYEGRNFTLEQRVLTQPRLLWQYIGWLIAPNIDAMGLHHDHYTLSVGLFKPWTTLLAILAWCCATLTALVYRKRFPVLLFAVLFYLVAHSMESGFWPLLMVFEHRSYLPSVAVSLLVAWLLVGATGRWLRIDVRITVLLLPLFLLVFLFIRVTTWADVVRLSQVNAMNHPGSVSAQYTFANLMLERYNEGASMNLGDSQRVDALVIARDRFERIYDIDSTHVPTLVKLYQLDDIYFPSLAEQNDWLGHLEEVLRSRALQPADITSLEVLVLCWANGHCSTDDGVPERILSGLQVRYPDYAAVSLLKYDYLRITGAPTPDRLAMLQRAIALSPSSVKLHSKMIGEYLGAGDTGAVYEEMRSMLERDPHRYYIPLYKSLFVIPDE
jgi:protein O-mannosyl-transferase